MAKTYSPEVKEAAKRLYVKGWAIQEISNDTGVEVRTLYNWKDAGTWDLFAPPDTVEQGMARKINLLVEKVDKTPAELEELKVLVSVFGDFRIKSAEAEKKQAEAKAIASGGYASPEFVSSESKSQGEKKPRGRGRKKTVKNDISSITTEMLDDVRKKVFFPYQEIWYQRKQDPLTRRTRMILKSRQIGATFYFAFEALDDAIRTGDNQLFLSSSRDQAEVFKAYIIKFGLEHFDVELKGQGVITLSNGAELRFLSTNSRTANSYHGHLYCDEVFWMPDFVKLWNMASGMSTHKKWRRTLFSVPSATSHPAYQMWNGNDFNAKLAESKRIKFDIEHKNLKGGCLGPDKIWRQIVTIEDAEEGGCDLFDIEELRGENSEQAFNNKYLCKWIDDANSVFNLATLMKCMVDTESWVDYNQDAAQPFGNRPVAIGYDPSRTRDNASLALLAIPLSPSDSWRLLKKDSWRGVNFQWQAARIKEEKEKHNVKHIGIDVSGIGRGVFELVEQFYRRVTPITYSVQTKTELVLKALDLIENGRFKFSAGDKEVTQAFMMITQTVTGNGQITYSANRSNATGHADLAWSIMHGFNYEPLAPKRKTTVAFSD